MNPLRQLSEHGQSPWLDYIDRDLLDSGTLSRMIAEDGLRGVTSNPSIFAKAIGDTDAYDERLEGLFAADPEATDKMIYEQLAMAEIRRACDQLRPVFDANGGHDGFVSLEVAPSLADDTEGTIEEARRLWGGVDRPNLMIKVPATPEGLPAIEALIALGIHVNVTLIFSVAHYEQVAEAFLAGLRRLAEDQPARLPQVASVASVFVSRVDGAVDAKLDAIGTPEALALRGTLAVANCRKVYQRYQALFEGEGFAALRAAGARPQRVLWGSTSTKNPAYRDVLYVEELIGPNTVNTLPPATLAAFRDHGVVEDRLTQGLDEAQSRLDGLAALGVDLDGINDDLQVAGVKSFADAFDGLLANLGKKRDALGGWYSP